VEIGQAAHQSTGIKHDTVRNVDPPPTKTSRRCCSQRGKPTASDESGDDLEPGRIQLAFEPAAGEQLAALFGDGGRAERARDAFERSGARVRRNFPRGGEQRAQSVAFLLERSIEIRPLPRDDFTLLLARAMPGVEQKVDLAPIASRELIHDPRRNGGLALPGHQRRGLRAPGCSQLLCKRVATRDEIAQLDAVQLVQRLVEI